MRIADLISTRREVYSIPEDTTVHDAARYLRQREVRLANKLSNNCTLVVTITGACQFSIASRSLASGRSFRNDSSFLAVSSSIEE